MSSEVYVYVFDAVLMFEVLVSLNVVHPVDTNRSAFPTYNSPSMIIGKGALKRQGHFD
jgi:hypothetical protein